MLIVNAFVVGLAAFIGAAGALWGYGGDLWRKVTPRTEWVYGDGRTCVEACSKKGNLEPIDLGVLDANGIRRKLCVSRWTAEPGARIGFQNDGKTFCTVYGSNEPQSNFACLCANQASGIQYPFGAVK
jgi:hypothetical protein